jgi:hypothetical protein
MAITGWLYIDYIQRKYKFRDKGIIARLDITHHLHTSTAVHPAVCSSKFEHTFDQVLKTEPSSRYTEHTLSDEAATPSMHISIVERRQIVLLTWY